MAGGLFVLILKYLELLGVCVLLGKSEEMSNLATVGLGVSDFGYRIITLLVSTVPCMDSVQRHGKLQKKSRR